MDASEEHDGYSSAEDPLNSDQEEDGGKKLVSKSVCLVWIKQQRQNQGFLCLIYHYLCVSKKL